MFNNEDVVFISSDERIINIQEYSKELPKSKYLKIESIDEVIMQPNKIRIIIMEEIWTIKEDFADILQKLITSKKIIFITTQSYVDDLSYESKAIINSLSEEVRFLRFSKIQTKKAI